MKKKYIEIKISDSVVIRKTIKKIVSERVNPQIWQWDYLGLKPLLDSITYFSKNYASFVDLSILDVGCGVKPYRTLFSERARYVGFDIQKNDEVDYVGVNWDMPFKKDEFDILISTQVLEHTLKIEQSIAEIKRVVKPGGYIFISVPLAFPEHEIPHDYYRFTRYGIMELFREFEIVQLKSSSGFMGTLVRLFNVFLHYIPYSQYFLIPIFLINNISGLFIDRFVFCLCRFFSYLKKFSYVNEIYNSYYMGFPESYFVILRNIK